MKQDVLSFEDIVMQVFKIQVSLKIHKNSIVNDTIEGYCV